MRGAASCLVSVAALCGACADPGAVTHRGTYRDAPWPAAELRPATSARGLSAQIGEVAILEGDAELVSGSPGQYGLRLDEDRNDLAAVATRFARTFGDRESTLVIFTGFSDRAGGGPAYALPLQHDTPGLGLEPLDQRAAFGVRDLDGLVNMKRLEDHAEEARIPLLVHEIAHRHLAYLRVAPAAGSTVAPSLLGRQGAHWQASLHTDGSVLGGHGFVETEPGRFVVARRNDALSSLDLYGLGLLAAGEVEPFFVIDDPVTEDGFAVPIDAPLAIADVVLGTRQPITIDQVVAAVGARPLDPSIRQLSFVLLTTPGVAASSTTAQAQAQAVDDLRAELEAAWPRWTRGQGEVCTRLDGCGPEARDAGPNDGGEVDAGAPEPPGGCRGGPASEPAGLLIGLLGLLRRRLRK